MKRLFSIIVPIYQNEANIKDTINSLLGLENQLPGWELELVFVDDGSTDNSYELLVDYAKAYSGKIKVIKLTRNFGQTPAIQAGMNYVDGDCIGIISADLQEPFEMFVDMLAFWQKGSRFIIGERKNREDGFWHRKVSNIYWGIVRRFAFSDFPNMGYDFCLLDREIVDKIKQINEKNSSIFVLIYWFGYRPVRIPIVRKRRKKGKSQWRFFKKISFTVDTLIGFTYLPSRFITLLSISSSFLAILYLIFLFYNWINTGIAPLGWMTVVGILLLLGALILFSLGIISEYLLRILDESRKRPPFVVEHVINNQEKKSSNQDQI